MKQGIDSMICPRCGTSAKVYQAFERRDRKTGKYIKIWMCFRCGWVKEEMEDDDDRHN